METPEEFLKHYHNNLPNDWLYEKREVVARLIREYTERALRTHNVVGQSEQLVCKGKCDHGYNDEFGNELFCSIKQNIAN